MAEYIINFNIYDTDSIKKAVEKVNHYKDVILQEKCDLFCTRVTELGYAVAKVNTVGISGTFGTHKMEDYITYKVTAPAKWRNNTYSYLIGIEKQFKSIWFARGGQLKISTIYPLEMIEFGSAGFALSQGTVSKRFGKIYNVSRGRGSMSGNPNDNKIVWHFIDANRNQKLGTAIKPTMPMYNAYLEMKQQMLTIAKEVFKAT